MKTTAAEENKKGGHPMVAPFLVVGFVTLLELEDILETNLCSPARVVVGQVVKCFTFWS